MRKSTQRQDLTTVARMFGALSDETRLGLCLALQEGERNVTALCARLKLPQPRVSHHLALLRLHGLVQNRRQGKEVYYSADAAGLAEVRRAAAAVLGLK
jgi:ArsR family transcriptional regulator